LQKQDYEISQHSLPPVKGEKMKLQIATIITALAVQACSTSKETYTETRTLTYPKKSVPHIKDFYLYTLEFFQTTMCFHRKTQNKSWKDSSIRMLFSPLKSTTKHSATKSTNNNRP
jgi:hypothetical protein